MTAQTKDQFLEQLDRIEANQRVILEQIAATRNDSLMVCDLLKKIVWLSSKPGAGR